MYTCMLFSVQPNNIIAIFNTASISDNLTKHEVRKMDYGQYPKKLKNCFIILYLNLINFKKTLNTYKK